MAAVLIVAAKSIIGAWVLITLTGSIRTASVHELTGSLANFRFLKKVYNVLVFLIIVFLSLVLWLLL